MNYTPTLETYLKDTLYLYRHLLTHRSDPLWIDLKKCIAIGTVIGVLAQFSRKA